MRVRDASSNPESPVHLPVADHFMTSTARPARILIVDDQPDIRKLLHLALDMRENTEIREAIDGEDGCTKALDWLPDLILLDVMMPGLDGLAVCRRIRQHPFMRDHTKVVMLSGRCQPKEVEQGIQAGCDAYLPKTFSPLKLLQRVNEMLDGETAPE